MLSSVCIGLAGVAAGVALLNNLPLHIFTAAPRNATLAYLSKITLKTFDQNPREFEEAVQLSSLLPAMESRGVALHAVVHETLGVDGFQQFFKGSVFLDERRLFYGPVERHMLFSAIFKFKVWLNIISNLKSGVKGNLEGNGSILGGVFVIGPGEQGILFEHREMEFGNYADLKDVLKALNEIEVEH